MSDTVKAWYASRAIWGGIIAILAAILRLAGFDLAEADQQLLVDAVLAIAGAAGGLLAIWGRVAASKPIGAPPIARPPLGALLLPAMLVLALGGGALSACASVQAESPAQRVYALQSDLLVPLAAAHAYVNRADAEPEAKAAIQDLTAAVDRTVMAAQAAVRAGDDPAIPAAMVAARVAADRLIAHLRHKGIL